MQETSTPSVNSWLEDELYPAVSATTVKPWIAGWKQVFESNGQRPTPTAPRYAAPSLSNRTSSAPRAPVVLVSRRQLVPLRGPALRIAENMTASLTMPVATSQRVMPVKVIDENRRLINQHRTAQRAEQDFLHALDRLGHRARRSKKFRR